ncbi:MAG: AAA family ATPase, partial [Rudanella sp.]|nr:AAA family ATPase [Rudanella sp.]
GLACRTGAARSGFGTSSFASCEELTGRFASYIDQTNAGLSGPAFLLSLATMNAEKDTKPFAIRRLEANQIGPFARLAIDFPEKSVKGKAEIHILTGENGTGKSTVLQMLAACVPSDTKFLDKKKWDKDLSQYWLLFSDDTKTLYNKQSVFRTQFYSVLRRD